MEFKYIISLWLGQRCVCDFLFAQKAAVEALLPTHTWIGHEEPCSAGNCIQVDVRPGLVAVIIRRGGQSVEVRQKEADQPGSTHSKQGLPKRRKECLHPFIAPLDRNFPDSAFSPVSATAVKFTPVCMQIAPFVHLIRQIGVESFICCSISLPNVNCGM